MTRDSSLRSLARLLFVLILAALAVSALLLWANRETLTHSEPSDILNPYLAGVGFGVVGTVIATHRVRHPIGWLLIGVALAFALPSLAMEAAIWRLSRSAPSAAIAVVQGNVAGALQLAAITAVAIFFPHGRLPGRRWRIAIALLVVSVALATAAEPFVASGPRFRDPGLAYEVSKAGDSSFAAGDVVEGNAFREANALLASSGFEPAEGSAWFAPKLLRSGGRPAAVLDFLQFLTGLFGMLVLAAAAVRLVAVAFRSTGTTRIQMKWLSYAVVVAISLVLLSALPFPYVEDLHLVAAVVLSLGVPWAIGVAVTRYRLYEIDRIINRTVVYGVVVAVLAGLFAGGVGVASTVLPTGSGDLGVAASTLAVAALFNPLRRRVQRAVDQRFFRSRYDPIRVAEALSARLRNRVDPWGVGGEWVDAVAETLHPESVGVWIKPAAGWNPSNDVGTMGR